MDDEGNYGYIKAGADTVTPFKSGAKRVSIGTVSQNTTIDVKTKSENWASLSNDNFSIGSVSCTLGGSINTAICANGALPSASATLSCNYNNSTGILTISGVGVSAAAIGANHGCNMTATVYLYE